ncbi:LysR family transcriptional regulator [Lacibacterium aquatile]|uniref:LysR family transcriptional regulator n=1 Tax=Lacibacterium aquatile TaxID=1168082 RepID=A0ABW5DUP8_9PROT
MDDWNELQLALAIARSGSLTGAAKLLKIDHSTVFRRLGALEKRLDLKLFERTATGSYLPTEAGAQMAAAAERMEDEAQALDRSLSGRDHRLTGRLRVTSSETLAFRLLTPHLAAFRAAHPGLTVELVLDSRVLSLSRREADIALRPFRPKEGDLWGRKLSDVAWTVYGRPEFAAVGMTEADLQRHPLIGWGEDASGIGAVDWIGRIAPASAIAYRSSSLINQYLAAKAGIGIAALPCYLADPDPDLVRILPPIPALQRELWIVTHSDLKNTARIRAFFEIVGEALIAQRPLMAGVAAKLP